MIGIYKITNQLNGKVYIGQSINIEQRWKQHKAETRRTAPLYLAFDKYGIDNFDFSVIEECPIEELDDREIYWISYYDSYNKGYNATLGGHRGLSIDPQVIYDLWDKGLSFGEICDQLSDKIHRAQIQKHLQSYSNYSKEESNRRGGIQARKKVIQNGFIVDRGIKQYSLSGEYIKSYKTEAEAGKETGINWEVIGRCLLGKQVQAGGYQWLINGEPKNLFKEKGFRFRFGVIQYTLEGEEIHRYPSVKAAAIQMNCSPKNISNCCKHKDGRVTACGFKWEYDYSYWSD